MSAKTLRRALVVSLTTVAGLAFAGTGAAHAADRRPPAITSVTVQDGGLLVRWGPDTFFPGSIPGEAATLHFGSTLAGSWDDDGKTTSGTVPASIVRAYAGQAPRVTVCYLWPRSGHASQCSASDPIPVGADNPQPYPPGAGQLRPVPAPRGLRVVSYADYRATVTWANGYPPYKKVLFRYGPGTQVDLPGNATMATTGVLVPGRTYTIKVKGGWSSGLSTRYSGWIELTWTAPKYPPYYPGGTQQKPYGPDTCRQGFVWREAVPSDRVCVTPATRDQTRRDNALAAGRRAGSGPYGPDTCREGFVWREAVPGDRVCVLPTTRDQTRRDNALAAARRA